MDFTGVSVVVPTIRETDTFAALIDLLLEQNDPKDLFEFIAVVCEKTSKESFTYIEIGKQKAEAAGVPFTVLFQTKPFLGGALQDAFMAAKGSHVIVETPDLNTAPENLPKMIQLAKEHPGAIISCSRWLPGGGFVNYNGLKKIWNQASQKFLAVLYRSHVSDFTYGVHMAPAALYQALNFQELKHPMNLEQMVIPLRMGVRVYEVPALMRTLENDVTVNPLLANFAYLRPAFRWRFAGKEKLLKPGTDQNALKTRLEIE